MARIEELRRSRPLSVESWRPTAERSASLGIGTTTETVYRHVIVPEIRGGATVMDDVFNEDDTGEGNENVKRT